MTHIIWAAKKRGNWGTSFSQFWQINCKFRILTEGTKKGAEEDEANGWTGLITILTKKVYFGILISETKSKNSQQIRGWSEWGNWCRWDFDQKVDQTVDQKVAILTQGVKKVNKRMKRVGELVSSRWRRQATSAPNINAGQWWQFSNILFFEFGKSIHFLCY